MYYKKTPRRIAALFYILTLFTTLFTTLITAFAASLPVLDFSYMDDPEYQVKMFSYQPDRYHLDGGSGTALVLRDITTSDGLWHTKAGLTFRV